MRRYGPRLMAVLTFASLGLTACAPRAKPPDSVGWRLEAARPVPARPDVGQPGRLPGIVPAHLQPLDGHIPLLWVDERIDAAVLAPDSVGVYIRWAVPLDTGASFVYLRLAARPFAPDSCPAPGTTRAVGDALLAAADGFSHPLRTQYGTYETGQLGMAFWNLADPPVAPGVYFAQACLVRGPAGDFRYTGASTNTVTVEVVRGLPDLVVHQAGVLRRTDPGRIYFTVADRIARAPRVVRGDWLEYEVSTPSGAIPASVGRAPLAPSGLSWVVSDFRIPDDGAFHDVTVRINRARAVPETDYANNATSYRLRVRATPAVVVLDRLMVRENCDGISPGDWRLGVLISPGGVGGGPSCRMLTTDAMDVDDERDLNLGIGLELIDAPRADAVYVEVHGFDCDDWFAGCGEEGFEVGGREDYAGMVSVLLTAADRTAGTPQMGTSRNGDCGENAFRASLRYLDRAAADAAGIRIVASFDTSSGVCRMLPPASP